MLAIRMQRTGRSGHAQFRVIVQEARFTPTSGKVVAYLGSYNPHTKTSALEKDKAAFYLEHGAQPSDRVARLLKQEGVKLPKWVNIEAGTKTRNVRNPDKLRKNRPAGAEPTAVVPEPEAVEGPAEEVSTAEPAAADANELPTESVVPESDTTVEETSVAGVAASAETESTTDVAESDQSDNKSEQVVAAEPDTPEEAPEQVATKDTPTEEKA